MNKQDHTLNDSVKDLTDTARSLAALLSVVDKNQLLLVEVQKSSVDNAEAIAHTITKKELSDEVTRSGRERKRDRARMIALIAFTTVLSLTLIGSTAYTAQEFKDARRDANTAYQASAQLTCEQRGIAWDAMQQWIAAQKNFLEVDTATNPDLKAKRLAAYGDLLASFPDVDCTAVGTGLAAILTPPAKGLVGDPNLAAGTGQ